MAPARGDDLANTQLANLLTDLRSLQASKASESGPTTRRKGKRDSGAKPLGKALADVREDLQEIAEHPYSQTGFSANPAAHMLPPEARGPARRLHTAMNSLVDSSGATASRDDVRACLRSFVSVLEPEHPLLKTLQAGAPAEKTTGVTGRNKTTHRSAAPEDLNEEKMFQKAFSRADQQQSESEEPAEG